MNFLLPFFFLTGVTFPDEPPSPNQFKRRVYGRYIYIYMVVREHINGFARSA